MSALNVVKKKVLCLVQLPPPIHGAAVMNEHVVNKVLPESDLGYCVLELDFSKTFSDMHGNNLRKILMAGKILIKLIIKLITYKPDIVYFTFAPMGAALLRDVVFTFVCRMLGKRIYFHLHGTGLSKRTSFIYRKAYSYLFKKDVLILLSDLLYQDVSKFIEKERCRFLPNAVFGLNNWRVHSDRHSNQVKILYMANFHPAKGLLTSIEIFKGLVNNGHDVVLTLVGSYTFYWSEKDMKQYLKNCGKGVSDRVNVYGPAYGDEKHRMLNDSDIFLYPTQHDAFPLVVVEALAHGLPVISSEQGAIPGIVEDGVSGFIVPAKDIDTYILQTAKLCTDKEYRKSMSKNAWQRYKNNYSYNVFDKNLIKILSE